MAENNKLSVEEVFEHFGGEVNVFPHFEIRAYLYDESLEDECEEFDWTGCECYTYRDEQELDEVKHSVVDIMNDLTDDIYGNGCYYLNLLEVMDEIQNDFKNKTEAYKDYDTIDCFYLRIDLLHIDSNDDQDVVFVEKIKLFENNEDIISIPPKNAKKDK